MTPENARPYPAARFEAVANEADKWVAERYEPMLILHCVEGPDDALKVAVLIPKGAGEATIRDVLWNAYRTWKQEWRG